MDEEAENEPISPEVSMFAKHQSAPNLLRLAWLPPSKIASFIGMPADGTPILRLHLPREAYAHFSFLPLLLASLTPLSPSLSYY